ncbi:MAG: hypothetical protein ACFFD4_30885 [Candidatus Odinarchaeota archaeon]
MDNEDESKELYRSFVENISEMKKQPYKAISTFLESSSTFEPYDEVLSTSLQSFRNFLVQNSINVPSLTLISRLSYSVAGDKKFNDDVTGKYEYIITRAFSEAKKAESQSLLPYFPENNKNQGRKKRRNFKIELSKIANEEISGSDKRKRIKDLIDHLSDSQNDYLWNVDRGEVKPERHHEPYEFCDISFNRDLFYDRRIEELIETKGIGIIGKFFYQLSFGFIGEDRGKQIPVVLAVAWTAAYSTLVMARKSWLEKNSDDDIVISMKEDIFMQLVRAYAQTAFHHLGIQYDEKKFQNILENSRFLLIKQLILLIPENRLDIINPNYVDAPLKTCINDVVVNLQSRLKMKAREKVRNKSRGKRR